MSINKKKSKINLDENCKPVAHETVDNAGAGVI